MPTWFTDIATEWAENCDPRNARRHLLRVERAVLTGASNTTALLAATAAQPDGRPTAKLLREFLSRHQISGAADPSVKIHACRKQWLDRVPERMRPPVTSYLDRLVQQQERATLYGNPGLTDKTINYQLKILVHLARHLAARSLDDWAAVAPHDIESFLARDALRQLTVAKAFFGFARQRKFILTDPTRAMKIQQRKGYTGPVLSIDQQRKLIDRWRRDDTDPRERVVGLLCLLHAASNAEVRHLKVDAIADDLTTATLGNRPHPVPLDPFTADAIDACLRQRRAMPTANPHLLVSFQTRLHRGPCSIALANDLVQRAGVTTKLLRATRLSEMTQQLDPRVVAEALGITHAAALHYVIGAVRREAEAFAATRED
jgi:integrase